MRRLAANSHARAGSEALWAIKMFARLERYDVEFDLPEAFLPEFPPAMFLQSRPELGDVSRGEVVSINNYYRLFADILTAVQLDGLRLLVTPFPQEEFNPTSDRKTAQPSLGVTCLDCHTNGHTRGQFHINPDTRPEQRERRRRWQQSTATVKPANILHEDGTGRDAIAVPAYCGNCYPAGRAPACRPTTIDTHVERLDR
jgi:cytochrome c peroxidase